MNLKIRKGAMMAKIKEAINNVDEIYQYINSFNSIQKTKNKMAECRHQYTEYQPKEDDTNTQESITCAVCGKDLPLPQPDDNI